MKSFYILAAALLLGSFGAKADNLYIVGDGVKSGWNLDAATALLSAPDNSKLFTGTVYLNADKDFKFLTVCDWGGLEYGAADDATLTDGEITLASGTDDNGYAKIKVSESANYSISVDIDKMSATIVKSDYQESEITYCSLFMVGSATAGGWSVDQGTALYQNQELPCEFEVRDLSLNEGTFKITTAIKGGGTWNGEYWYFRNADDAARMTLNQEGDLQWEISAAGDYNIVANVLNGSILIEAAVKDAVSDVCAGQADAVYYSIDGYRVACPRKGLYIKMQGDKISKVRF